MRYPIAPEKRCLTSAGAKNIWKFPDNYVDCVAERLIDAFPQVRRKTVQRDRIPGAAKRNDR